MSIEFKDRKIIISENVVSIFNSYKQLKKNDPESGGILLGQINEEIIYINKVTIPNKKDKSSRFNFVRNSEIAQILIEHEFVNSNRKNIYLGEWHTHPEDIPTPSGTDISMIKGQFAENKRNVNFLLMFIIGRQNNYYGLYSKSGLKDILNHVQTYNS